MDDGRDGADAPAARCTLTFAPPSDAADNAAPLSLTLRAHDAGGASADVPLAAAAGARRAFFAIAGPWSPCSVPCGGGGTRSRARTCLDGTGKRAAVANCPALVKAAAATETEFEACGAISCSVAHWVEDTWGSCSAACAAVGATSSPTQTRATAVCTSGGVSMPFADCALLPPPSSLRPCNVDTCVAGDAVREAAAPLCELGQTRDAAGGCCAAVGPSGLCCLAGLLDDCGVCGGSGASCAFFARVLLSSGALADVICTPALAGLGLNSSAAARVASDSLRSALTIALGPLGPSLAPAPLPSLGLTCTGAPVFALSVHLTAGAAAPTGTVTGRLVDRLVGASLALGGPYGYVALLDVDGVERVGACGNGACEWGEPGVCEADCPRGAPLACPLADAVAGPLALALTPALSLCSSMGFCIAATGECMCLAGYSGRACEACALGFSRGAMTEMCTKAVPIAVAAAAAAGAAAGVISNPGFTPGSNAFSALIAFAAAVISALLGASVASFLIVRLRGGSACDALSSEAAFAAVASAETRAHVPTMIQTTTGSGQSAVTSFMNTFWRHTGAQPRLASSTESVVSLSPVNGVRAGNAVIVPPLVPSRAVGAASAFALDYARSNKLGYTQPTTSVRRGWEPSASNTNLSASVAGDPLSFSLGFAATATRASLVTLTAAGANVTAGASEGGGSYSARSLDAAENGSRGGGGGFAVRNVEVDGETLPGSTPRTSARNGETPRSSARQRKMKVNPVTTVADVYAPF